MKMTIHMNRALQHLAVHNWTAHDRNVRRALVRRGFVDAEHRYISRKNILPAGWAYLVEVGLIEVRIPGTEAA